MRAGFLTRSSLFAAMLLVVAVAACTSDPDVAAPGESDAIPDGLVVAGAPRPSSFVALPDSAMREVPVNWAVFAQSNLWLRASQSYAVWVRPDGHPMIGRYSGDLTAVADDAAAGDRSVGWEVFDLSTIDGNPLRSPVRRDSHNVLAVAVDADGYVHVAGNMHSGQLRYVRSARPHRIDAWVDVAMVGFDENQVTYPVFEELRDGTLLFFYRSGSSTSGDLILNAYRNGDWERVATVLEGTSVGASPYPNQITVDSSGRIHLAHTWRTGLGPQTNEFVSYISSDDAGRSWQTVDGVELDLPVGIDPAAVAWDVPADVVVVNNGGLAVDDDGRPHAAFRVRGPGAETQIWVIGHDGSSWFRNEIVGTGPVAGRPALAAGPGSGGELWLVWPTPASASGTGVSVAEVSDANAANDGVALLTVSASGWEPSLERTRTHVSMLVPAGSDDGAGVVSYRSDVVFD